MARLTPQDILRISEPIELIYEQTVDDLLINIARHFKVTGWERTRYWEIKKLSELGALTKESAAIIAANTKMLPAEIEKAFLQVSEKACLDIDPQLRRAAKEGKLLDPGTSVMSSPIMRDMVQSYVDQAIDKMNLTNTTMLESTRQAYMRGIGQIASEEQLAEAKLALESGALDVVTGTETRVRAIEKTMQRLSDTGIAGFYDRAGRAWSPEAYSSMVIRTTSHNAAIQAIKTRQEEFGGGDIFQVSSHPGARPLCYPYQGKFLSWSSGPGTFIDGAGHEQEYDDITNTSYGEPAGLFGINCGHYPIPVIPGYTFPQKYKEQSEKETDKEYAESQQQRALERQIRRYKRDAEMADALADPTLKASAEARVKAAQQEMRAFIDQTGRARRYDREQIPKGAIK